MKDYLTEAIQFLRPNSQYSYFDNDYSTIVWHVLDGDAPSQAEVDAAIEQLKTNDIAQAEARAAARLVAQAKLEALGLTIEDIQALGL